MPSPVDWPLRTNDNHELHGALQVAIEKRSGKDVQVLVASGAPVLAQFHLDEWGKDTGNALDLVILHRRYDLALQLLKLEEPPGAELARGCRRALAWAAREGRLPLVQQLLGHEIDVAQQDDHGRSALLLAAMRGHGQCVNALLEAGALESEKDSGDEVKQWAAHWKLQTSLRDGDASGSAEDSNAKGQSTAQVAQLCSLVGVSMDLRLAMQSAMMGRAVKDVKELVKKGAPLMGKYDLDDLGNQTGTALDLAVLHKRYDLATLAWSYAFIWS